MFGWMVAMVDHMGSFGVGVLMLIENLFPPLPSSLIMPLAGYRAARGELDLFWVLFWGTFGSMLGMVFWYYVGKWIGARRLKDWTRRRGRWLTLRPEEVDRATAWFAQRGRWAVAAGRLVPAVRTLISVPAGMADMHMRTFLSYSTVGTFVWTAMLTLAGYELDAGYERVADFMGPIMNLVVIGLVVAYGWRVATFRPSEN